MHAPRRYQPWLGVLVLSGCLASTTVLAQNDASDAQLLLVIPAKAGIQLDLPSMESRSKWTPASAGVTDNGVKINGVTNSGVNQTSPSGFSGKLLLTGGVTQLEGSAGGGLTPWAVIGGYGTRDQIGANAFYTRVSLPDYHLDEFGAMVGFYNRVELSIAEQRFDTESVGAALGLGAGFTLKQTVIGVKVRLAGDLVLDQASWMPQISVGAQYKKNNQEAVVKFVGAQSATGTDYYVSATKLLLGQSLLLNGTVRFTKANQIGILGFGTAGNDDYEAQFEGSIAYLLNRHLAIGAEYRSKPDKLAIASEDDWYDVFIAWAPNKHLSFTLAYANLGNIVIRDEQRGVYVSVQVGF